MLLYVFICLNFTFNVFGLQFSYLSLILFIYMFRQDLTRCEKPNMNYHIGSQYDYCYELLNVTRMTKIHFEQTTAIVLLVIVACKQLDCIKSLTHYTKKLHFVNNVK